MSGGRATRVALFLSWRSLTRGNWGILVTTIAMMGIVYLNLLFLPSLIQGATNHVIERLVDTVTSNLVVTPTHDRLEIPNAVSYERELVGRPGVAAVTAERVVANRIYTKQYSGRWQVSAVDPVSYARVFATPGDLIAGHWLSPSDTNGIVLGIGVAGGGKAKLADYSTSLRSVHVGDVVTVVFRGDRQHRFVVRGIFNDQFRIADAKAFITDAAAARLLPGEQAGADAVYVKTKPRVTPEAVAAEITGLRPDVSVQTSTQLEGQVHEQTAGFKLIDNILRAVSALVAAITIFIVTYIDLVNRRRQIGIERALGIRGSAIIGSYCLKATAYAITGVVIGTILFKAAAVPFVAAHPFHFPNGPVTLAPSSHEMRRDALILILVAISAAFLPAWRSTRIRILDAIWN